MLGATHASRCEELPPDRHPIRMSFRNPRCSGGSACGLSAAARHQRLYQLSPRDRLARTTSTASRCRGAVAQWGAGHCGERARAPLRPRTQRALYLAASSAPTPIARSTAFTCAAARTLSGVAALPVNRMMFVGYFDVSIATRAATRLALALCPEVGREMSDGWTSGCSPHSRLRRIAPNSARECFG